MEWKSKIKNESCADELEEMIINYVKAGFWSNDKILEECEQYIKDFYRNECNHITKDDLLEIIKVLCKEFQNTGNQENFLKLQSAFDSLMKQGIVALHYAGYTQSDGFADCNGMAGWIERDGKKVIGCCFYTAQDLERILHKDDMPFYISFGNYFEEPTAEEIGQMIVDELRTIGFCVEWDGTAGTRIEIKNLKWDKYYTDSK